MSKKENTPQGVDELRQLIDEAVINLDAPSSQELAQYLIERGVTVAPLSVKIGSIVYKRI